MQWVGESMYSVYEGRCGMGRRVGVQWAGGSRRMKVFSKTQETWTTLSSTYTQVPGFTRVLPVSLVNKRKKIVEQIHMDCRMTQ